MQSASYSMSTGLSIPQGQKDMKMSPSVSVNLAQAYCKPSSRHSCRGYHESFWESHQPAGTGLLLNRIMELCHACACVLRVCLPSQPELRSYAETNTQKTQIPMEKNGKRSGDLS